MIGEHVTSATLLLFIGISLTVLITPGVTVTFIINQALKHGKRVAFPMSLGVVAGDGVCLLILLFILQAILAVSPKTLTVIQVIGALYIVYLGMQGILSEKKNAKSRESVDSHSFTLFRSCFFVTVLNPKSVLFFSAFLPQFIDKNEYYTDSFLFLGIIFLCVAMMSSYAYGAIFGSLKGVSSISSFTDKLGYITSTILVLLGLSVLWRL